MGLSTGTALYELHDPGQTGGTGKLLIKRVDEAQNRTEDTQCAIGLSQNEAQNLKSGNHSVGLLQRLNNVGKTGTTPNVIALQLPV